MIISERYSDNRNEFESLLHNSKLLLEEDAKFRTNDYLNYSPMEIEDRVYEMMCIASKGSIFENKIKIISGLSFPDIVTELYGVEVKSSHRQDWKSTANSVLESTRVDNIEYVYILFAKLAQPLGFKYRLYQDCIYDIAVTHSPRYRIDMNLVEGSTIFHKMEVTYDELRKKDNPISYFVNYYRSISKPGEEPWWMESSDLNENNMKPTIGLWRNLSTELKDAIRVEMMARFPKLFGDSTSKYTGPASYLVAKYGVINPSFRDMFSAGGRVNLLVGTTKYIRLSRVFNFLNRDIKDVVESVKALSVAEAKFYWQLRKEPKKEELFSIWRSQLFNNAREDELTQTFLEELLGQYEEEK